MKKTSRPNQKQIKEARKIAKSLADKTLDPNYQRSVLKKLRDDKPLQFAFLTFARKDSPPFSGCLIPISSHSGLSNKNEFYPRYFLRMLPGEQPFIPAITIDIDGLWDQGNFRDANVRYSLRYMAPHQVARYDTVVASRKKWIETLWNKNWVGSAMEDSVPVTLKSGPIEYILGFQNLDQKQFISRSADRAYLGVMLLWDYWSQNDFTDDNKCDELKALKLASENSDRRTFVNTRLRVGCFHLDRSLFKF